MPGRHGTFDDCIARLPEIAALGFDVVYLTPIHPIGRTNRKGRNNALKAAPGDPGSPYAIGAPEGGHDAVHPRARHARRFPPLRRGLPRARHGGRARLRDPVLARPSLAQASIRTGSSAGPTARSATPRTRRRNTRTSSIRISTAPTAIALWHALRDVVLFWVEQGVRIFRVDNPHTKPFPFWEWLIREVQERDPDVIFLSEAFTRPKIMKALAKLGFTPVLHLFHLAHHARTSCRPISARSPRYPEREYFRPNFFVNTPDILPFHLQSGEPWMFKSRVALAATLSANYGIYNGFELLEHEPIPGQGGISRLREIRDQGARLEQARQHQGLHRAGSTGCGATIRRCCRPATCASPRSTTAR